MKTIYLIRHALSAGQEPDAPLTPQGRAQAERLAGRLDGLGIEAVISSPYARAEETALPFCRAAGLQLERQTPAGEDSERTAVGRLDGEAASLIYEPRTPL